MDELERLERRVERVSNRVANSLEDLARALRELRAEVAGAKRAPFYVLPWEDNTTNANVACKGSSVWYAPLVEV